MANASGRHPALRSEPSKVTIEKALEIKRVDDDVFENLQEPFTWGGGVVVPGGVLMALAASAAYETLPSDFAIDMLQAQFLKGPKSVPAMQIKVQRLNDGGRFASRVVSVEQEGTVVCHVTCSFVRTSSLSGPSMIHSQQRATAYDLERITLDDLDYGRTDLGPWMRFQRLPLVGEHPTPTKATAAQHPENLIYTSAAHIAPPIRSKGHKLHALGIIVLSDYHILDCPPHLHGKSVGQAQIGDVHRTIIPTEFERYTSMNHSIHFHVHDGFRADELNYIEARSPWASRRRGYIESKIFTKDGLLVATCTQRAYYVLASIVKMEESKL